MRRFGVFGALRRHRLGLSLAFGYALLLNALLTVLPEAAPTTNPFTLSAATPLCGEPGSAPQGQTHHHQQECPLCGPACTMGGCTPAAATIGAMATLSAPRFGEVTPTGTASRSAYRPRSVYASDPQAQAPPSAA